MTPHTTFAGGLLSVILVGMGACGRHTLASFTSHAWLALSPTTAAAQRVVCSPSTPAISSGLQAYRDWGVELFDWQSQSSVLADAGGARATCRRMMPTVGCEADAIAYTQDAVQLFGAGPGAQPATVAPDGTYSAGPVDISSPDLRKAAFEHCLALPTDEPEQGRMRLRVVQQLRRGTASGAWQLDSVELHSERCAWRACTGPLLGWVGCLSSRWRCGAAGTPLHDAYSQCR